MAALPQGGRHRPAAHARHGDVEEDQVDAARRYRAQAFGAGARLQHAQAARFEDLPHQGAVGAVVVGDENGAAGAGIGALRLGRLRGGRDGGGLADRGQHQPQARLCPAARAPPSR